MVEWRSLEPSGDHTLGSARSMLRSRPLTPRASALEAFRDLVTVKSHQAGHEPLPGTGTSAPASQLVCGHHAITSGRVNHASSGHGAGHPHAKHNVIPADSITEAEGNLLYCGNFAWGLRGA